MTTIRYQLSEQEVIRCLLEARRMNHPWEGIRGAIIWGVFAFLYIARHVYRAKGTEIDIALYGSVTALCAAIVFYALTRLYVRRTFARTVRANPALYTASQELTFDHSKMVIVSPAIKHEFAWTLFKRCVQDEQYFYFLSGAGGFFAIVPKQAFAAPELADFLRCTESLLTV